MIFHTFKLLAARTVMSYVSIAISVAVLFSSLLLLYALPKVNFLSLNKLHVCRKSYFYGEKESITKTFECDFKTLNE